MTKGIWESMKDRDKLFIKQLGKNNPELTNAYKKKRNYVKNIVDKAKDLHLWKSAKSVMDTPKKMWKLNNPKQKTKRKCSAFRSHYIRRSVNN